MESFWNPSGQAQSSGHSWREPKSGWGREEPWGESSQSHQGRTVVLVCHPVVLGKGERQGMRAVEDEDEEEDDGKRADFSKQLLGAVPCNEYCPG